MARFYGTVQGGRGMASRLGHANTGLCVSAQSYSGDVFVNFLTGSGEEDHVYIGVREHGHGTLRCLYKGPVADLLKPAAVLTFFQQAAADVLKAA